jgi:hypothetical protein
MSAEPHDDCLSPFTHLQEVRNLIQWVQNRMLTVSRLFPPTGGMWHWVIPTKPRADCPSPFTRLQNVRDRTRWLQDRMLTVSFLLPTAST